MTAAKSPTYNEPIWDKANSTFMRTIYLQNGYSFVGYSKRAGRNERRDKIDLLTNWILRDLKNGYLDKNTSNPKITPVDRIEYFVRNGNGYEIIIILYYDFPELVNLKWMENKKFAAFIMRMYDMIKKDVNVTSIINALEVRTRAPRLDPFDISTRRFLSMHDLNAFVLRLRSQGDYADDAIHNFYIKYKAKYFQQ